MNLPDNKFVPPPERAVGKCIYYRDAKCHIKDEHPVGVSCSNYRKGGKCTAHGEAMNRRQNNDD